MESGSQQYTPEEDVLVCYCFEVYRSEIIRLIKEHQPQTTSELVALGEAGNGCSSCWCDLDELIKRYT